MEGLTSVLARISAIEVRFGPGPPAPHTAVRSTRHFEAVLRKTLVGSATGGSEPYASAAQPAPPVTVTTSGYQNGSIPISALRPVADTDHFLAPTAAAMLERMTTDARTAGVSLGVVDGYRSFADQVTLAEAKGLYSEGGLAAKPGTSNHGWGLAVDLALDDDAQAWITSNAYRYGFVNDVPREPWHWTYKTDPK